MSHLLDNMDFSAQIVRERLASAILDEIESRSLTLRKIESETGIPKSRVDLLSKGRAKLSVEDLLSISRWLRVNPAKFVSSGPEIAVHSQAAKKHTNLLVASLVETSVRMTELMGHQIDFKDIIAWHRASGGRLENWDQIKPFIGLYTVDAGPEPVLEAVEIGPHSLTATSLQTPEAGQVNKYIQGLARAARHDIAFTYVETAAKGGWKMFERSVLVDFPGAGPKYQLDYCTLLLEVAAPNGDKFIMNFSTHLGSELVD